MKSGGRLRRARWLLFEPCDGNSVELLAGGERFFGALREAIEGAKREVLLCSYLWWPDSTGLAFLEAAAACARRGLAVRVLMDGVGAHGIPGKRLREVEGAGARVGIHHPVRLPGLFSRLLRRNHRKVAVVDGEVAFVGGFGFADPWVVPPPEGWWDLGARVAGPVVSQFRRLFGYDWQRSGGEPLPDPLAEEPPSRGGERLRVLAGRRGRPELLRQLLWAIHDARRRVLVATPYFIPGFRLRHRLRVAARRGLDVRLLLPGPRTDHLAIRLAGRRHYGSLLGSGVRIFEYRRGFLHSKYALVDLAWGAVGSSNLDSWSARFNLEADLEVLSPGGLRGLEARFLEDLGAAREIGLADWARRPLRSRILERVFGWFDPVL
ncbi:MAG: phospholipase D-like domain-containing protein [Planctomycetes bacterium]|nr:phospholipase D-like domain-containing protein [Planctomycetota bacterium]